MDTASTLRNEEKQWAVADKQHNEIEVHGADNIIL